MAIDINTQSAAYQQYLNGFENLRQLMKPRLALFAKLPRAKQRLWLQKDPLFRKLLKNALQLAEWAERLREEVEND